MKTPELITKLAADAGITKTAARAVLKSLQGVVDSEMSKSGGVVTIPRLCKFRRAHYKARKIVSIKTKKLITIPAHDKVKIIPLDGLRGRKGNKPSRRRGK